MYGTPMSLYKHYTHCVICRYTAKITEKDVEEDEVVVHFDGWSARYDEYVRIKSGRLRHISPEKLEQMEREKALKAKVGVGEGKGSRESVKGREESK